MTDHQPGPVTDRPHDSRYTSFRLDRRMIISGFLFGCGIAGSIIDLFIFHLGLQWHHL